jgi:hypothetical protein
MRWARQGWPSHSSPAHRTSHNMINRGFVLAALMAEKHEHDNLTSNSNCKLWLCRCICSAAPTRGWQAGAYWPLWCPIAPHRGAPKLLSAYILTTKPRDSPSWCWNFIWYARLSHREKQASNRCFFDGAYGNGAIAWDSKLLYFGARVPASCSCMCPYCASDYRPMSCYWRTRTAALKPQAESAWRSLTAPIWRKIAHDKWAS